MTAPASTLPAARRLMPGLLASLLVAIAATFLSEHYGGPVMLFALLIGMALPFLSQDGPTAAGIDFASKTLLRMAVALLGAQVTFAQITALGPIPVVTVIVGVVFTIGIGMLGARLLGRPCAFGILTGGAVAICGASAALALSSVLPRTATSERDTAFTVIAVSTLSTVAMVAYPMIVALFHLDHTAAGVFFGGTIHDVAQVVGAGYSVSEETGNIAVVTKLLRVALLLPTVFVLSATMPRTGGNGARPRLPAFLVGFALLVVANSLGMIPADLLVPLKELSRWSLVAAISALGMKTSLKSIADVGGPAVLLVVVETVLLAALVLAVVVGFL